MAVRNMGGSWKGGKWTPEKGRERVAAEISHVESAFKEKHPQIQTAMDGLDAGIMREALDELDANLAMYPALAKTLRYVGVPQPDMPDIGNATAYTTEDGRKIVLSPAILGNKQKFQSLTESADRTMYQVSGAKALIAHEVGHIIYSSLKEQQKKTVLTPAYKKYDAAIKAVDALHKQHQKAAWQISGEGLKSGKLVSGYAKKEKQEFFAEAYALLRKHGKEYNEYTRAIANIVDVYKKQK